ncbi:MAG: mannose-1-phosphate guanylyltransferase, partial [Erysipelotrichaceae bacterium]|nr:mannose-1-phosphate guanylyltransferase [Erysipelotrichaceae bacterium]
MNIILLSGGSGTRLWPLSNETMSKQFLRLLRNEKGEKESMVQRVFRQLKETKIDANIVIATGKSQVKSIRFQLGEDSDLVVEPERRNT